MISKITVITIVLAIMVCMVSLPAFAEGPDFSNPAIYADGEVWATKGLGTLPAPNGKNNQSFDKLFLIDGQLPVAEAAPRNRHYNGGRWWVHNATWLINNPPTVVSYAEIESYVEDGYLMVVPTNTYFECPLLPFKG